MFTQHDCFFVQQQFKDVVWRVLLFFLRIDSEWAGIRHKNRLAAIQRIKKNVIQRSVFL